MKTKYEIIEAKASPFGGLFVISSRHHHKRRSTPHRPKRSASTRTPFSPITCQTLEFTEGDEDILLFGRIHCRCDSIVDALFGGESEAALTCPRALLIVTPPLMKWAPSVLNGARAYTVGFAFLAPVSRNTLAPQVWLPCP